MKLKIQSLLLIAALTAVIFSCKDDDKDKDESKLSNAYIFDGTTKPIKAAIFEDNTSETGGGYYFFLSPTTIAEDSEEGTVEYIELEVPKEMMGEKFELTEEQLYNWGWWFEFSNEETELYYTGFGAEGEMEDVKSGTISAIRNDGNAFTIEIDIVFTDDKTIKLHYSGEMVNADDEEGPSRQSTRKVNGINSPNN